MINRIGEKHITKQGYEIEIIEYYNSRNCTILFQDGNIIKNREYADIKKGNIKNHNHKAMCGLGYRGVEENFSNSNEISILAHIHWSSMFTRCYNEKHLKRQPTYIGCEVDFEWHNFQNFLKWFCYNYNPLFMKNWHLDKDVLIKGNKLYSSKTCCLIPKEINNLISINKRFRNNLPVGVHKQKNRFIAQYRDNGKPVYLGMFINKIDAFNAYKKGKEQHVYNIALKYKDLISNDVYNALINYKININD